jgi:hypothetical protein
MEYIELVLLGNLSIGEQDDVVMSLDYLGFYVHDIVQYRETASLLIESRKDFTDSDVREIERMMNDEFSDLDYEIQY